jgi:predicted AAA+ superfamily ATPase
MTIDNPNLEQLLSTLNTLLDRYGNGTAAVTDFSHHQAYRWDGDRRCVKPITRPVQMNQDDLIGIDEIKQSVFENTRQFISGRRANNVLLWGERGTGKSSLVKSLLTTFAKTPLRMIQVYKHDILTIQSLYETIAANVQYRFILFIDDLSFEESQTDYKEMKTLMDGGLEAVPDNLLFYATSNRKHLIPTKFSDNDGDEVRPSDTVEEKVSLVDRFGLRYGFYHFSQDTYLAIVASYAEKYGMRVAQDELKQRAVQWALAAGGRNGRIAEQFVRASLSSGTE